MKNYNMLAILVFFSFALKENTSLASMKLKPGKYLIEGTLSKNPNGMFVVANSGTRNEVAFEVPKELAVQKFANQEASNCLVEVLIDKRKFSKRFTPKSMRFVSFLDPFTTPKAFIP